MKSTCAAPVLLKKIQKLVPKQGECMGSCNTCWAWNPKIWDKWHWVDKEAYCTVHKRNTKIEETCEYWSILKPNQVTMIDRTPLSAAASKLLDEEDLEGFEVDKPRVIAPLKIVEYEHQKEAFERFKDEEDICLFLEPGLGKSAISLHIAVHKFRNKSIDALLIIAPNGVHKQWFTEQIPMWMKHYRCKYEAQLLGGKGGREAYPFRYNEEVLQIVVVNVDTFSTPKKWQDIVDWANHKKTFIVLDEATDIKNINAKRTQRILFSFNKVKRRGKQILQSTPLSVARAVLTGTPLTNGPFDLWSIIEFIHPSFFGLNYYAFKKHYGLFYTMMINQGGNLRSFDSPITKDIWQRIKDCNTYGEAFANFGVAEKIYDYIQTQDRYQGPYRRMEELKEKISEIAMFRKLTDCVDMPDQVYNKHLVDMTKEQAILYYEMENMLIAEYQGVETTAVSKLTAMIRLQQIISGFICGYDVSDEDTDIAPSKEVKWIGQSNNKLDLMYKDIEVAVDNGPVIIITHFSCEAARIYEDLLYNKYRACLFTGWKIEGSLEEFQAGKYDCLVANIRKIRRGFNLQNSHQTFFYSNTFSLDDRLQTEGRTFRIGQKEKAIYNDYITKDTIDMKIVAALRQKRSLLDYMMDSSVKDFLTKWDEVTQVEYNDLIL